MANTLAQHLGFADPDLGSPEHDRLVTWLTEPETLLVILRRAWPQVLDEKHAGAQVIVGVARQDGSCGTDQDGVVWERVTHVALEKPILRDGSYVVGFVDAVATVGWGLDGRALVQATFYVEAKPRIQSVGALLRQVNLYRLYAPGSHWVVVCNDSQHRPLLYDQGIALVTPADIVSDPPECRQAAVPSSLTAETSPPDGV
ncbi:MAG: hypothetical protein JXD18_13265 [Anaerolineae bacterium]|nr:hypothetical protein [Anaerolineae bacterium]